MKKRIVCALLSLILLIGVMPVSAAAADYKISEAAITVLKQLTTFHATCYHVSGKEYRIGYGTVCTETHHFNTDGTPKESMNQHKIAEKKADTELRAYLSELNKQVNSFASKNNLALTQNQHDALVVFSHGVGTAWMSGTGSVKSAIISKANTNDLLTAMANLNDGQMRRHQVEVNMYANNKYSNTIPSSFATVTYDANGGRIAQNDGNTYIMNFDSSKSIDHISANKSGAILLGWYTEPANGKWMPKLDADCAGKTLYAYWQNGYNTAVGVNYTLPTSKLVNTFVYVDCAPDAEVLRDTNGAVVAVTSDVTISKDFIDAKGGRWGFVADKGGWVKVGTPKADVVNSSVIATATVTYNGYLNVRSDAGTDSKIVGALYKSTTVNIYEIKTVNGHRWGRCDAGWICLTYTSVNMLDGKTVSDAGIATYAFTGKIVGVDVDAYVAPGDESDLVSYMDDQGNIYDYIPVGSEITIANLTVAECAGSEATWAKATWKNVERDKNNKEIKVTRSAWIPISVAGRSLGDTVDYHVALNTVMYTVVSETTNVRQNAGDGYPLAFTLNKGSEVEVNQIVLVGENIWGKITSLTAIPSEKVGSDTGWINLATKYVKRSSEITIDKEETNDHDSKLIGTVINTDSVKVRKTGALYGAVMGSLNRGVTVRVWESKDAEWYKVDSNQNGTYDYEEDGWVSGKYLNVRTGSIGQNGTEANGNNGGTTATTDGTGTGIVANTYSGVNVRQGAGTGYAAVGKLLPGTRVEILEVKNAGAGKWGRTDKGWVYMDYISMVKYNPAAPAAPAPDPIKGNPVDSLDKVEKTTTTAVYTGHTLNDCAVMKEPIAYDASEWEKIEANTVRNLGVNDNVTIHELAAVTRTVESDNDEYSDSNTVTTITTTTYWARVNDGWIQDPETNLALTALDEKVHTVTGADTLKVREYGSSSAQVLDILEKGAQVRVTALEIERDKVWGRVETEEGSGWIRLDYTSEGAYYVNKPAETTPTTPAPSEPVFGSSGNTNSGGFVTNSGGYKYTGKVINTNSVNVRASASTSAKTTTTLKNGAALVIYETTISENMAWGRCDAGWVYLYYVDLTPCVSGAVDARVVYNDNTVAYSDANCTTATGTYQRMSVVDIYEVVGKMARTDLGWVNVDNLL